MSSGDRRRRLDRPGEPEAHRVLHVEDDREFAELVGTFLERESPRLEVTIETDPRRVLDSLEEVDCIVSDFEMPGMTGLELLQAVREEAPDLPFILYTGRGSEDVAAEAIRHGVTDYLQKGGGSEQYALLANRIENAVERYYAEAEVRQAYLAIESASEGIGILDERGRFTFVNEAYAELYGYEPGELVGAHWERLYFEEDVDRISEEILPRVHEQGFWRGETRGRRRDGSAFVEDHVLTATEDGGLICSVRDISDRKAYQRSLHETRERMEFALRATNATVWELDPSTGTLTTHPGSETVLGAPAGTIERYLEAVHPEDRDRVRRAVESAASGDPFAIEYRLEIDGTVTWVADHGRPIDDGAEGDGGVDRVIGVATDVTGIKSREERIRSLHETTRELLAADTKHEVAEAVAEAARYTLGYPNNIVRLLDDAGERLVPVAMVSEILVDDLDRRPTYAVGEETAGLAFERGEPLVYENVREIDDEYEREGGRSAMYLPMGDHGVLSITDTRIGVFEEADVQLASLLADNAAAVMDHVERARALRDRERVLERYETIIQALGDPVFVIDDEGNYRFVNDAFVEETGYDEAAILGEHVSTVIPDDDVQKGIDVIRELLDDPDRDTATVEMERITAEGERRQVESHFALLPPARDGGFRGTAGVIRDITERTRRERRIEALHEASRALLRAESREEIAERTVMAAKEALGQPIAALRLLSDDGDALVPAAITDEAREILGDRPTYRIGEAPPGRVFGTDEPLVLEDVQTIDDGHPRGTARASMYLSIGEYGTLSIGATEVGAFDSADVQLAKILVRNAEVAFDRIERERELQRQNERLEEFTAVVSHDLRNPLTVANGRLAIAREDCDSGDLDAVATALDRMERLIDGLLEYAREGRALESVRSVELASVVERSWRNVPTAEASLESSVDGTIHADQTRLVQLFENVFRNAVEHAGPGTRITVGALDDGFFVSDDGPGIPPEDRDRVFEVGFSTNGDRTGLGLSIVKQIVDAHGWTIRATDSADGGARFEVHGVVSGDPG